MSSRCRRSRTSPGRSLHHHLSRPAGGLFMIRSIVFLIFPILALGSALAQDASDTTLTLEAALELAPTASADALDASRALADAERALARLRADPQALGLDVFAAEQEVAAELEGVTTENAAAALEAATAFTELLEAQNALDENVVTLDVAQVTLEATRARRDAGAATDLDVAEAANDVAAAEREVGDAQATRDLALATLRGQLLIDATALTPIDDADLPEVPTLEAALTAIPERNTRLAAAQRTVEAARRQLAAVDNAASAQADIDAARDTLTSAEADVEALLDSLELTIQQSYASVAAAQNRLASAAESYDASATSLEGQRARLQAGSIAPLAFRQAELSHLGSASSLAAARHALLLAILRLEGAILE